VATPAKICDSAGAGVAVVDVDAPRRTAHTPSSRATPRRAAPVAAAAIDVDSEGGSGADTAVPATPATAATTSQRVEVDRTPATAATSQRAEVDLTDAGPADPVDETPLPVLHYEPTDDVLRSLPPAPFAWAAPLPRAPAGPSAAPAAAAVPTPDSATRGVLHYSPTRTPATSTRSAELRAGPAGPPPVTPLVAPNGAGVTPDYRALATGNLKARCAR